MDQSAIRFKYLISKCTCLCTTIHSSSMSIIILLYKYTVIATIVMHEHESMIVFGNRGYKIVDV